MAAPLPPSMDSVALMLALLAAPLRLPLVLTPPAPAVPSLPLGSVNDEIKIHLKSDLQSGM